MLSYSNHKTAILIFARSSKEEIANKSIHNGQQLFDVLTKQVIETVSKTQLPYFHFSEEKQIGTTFGQRFANAIQEVFQKGFHQIITIGNDTPQLKASHILEAEKQLLSNKSVVGRSFDGGFYLMGLHKSQFDTCTFQQLAWQTSKISKQLLNLITQKNGEVFQLPMLLDIDNQSDIKSIISHAYGFSKGLLRAIVRALGFNRNSYSIPTEQLRLLPLGVMHNKGSPIFLSL